MSREDFYNAVKASLYRGSLPDWQRKPLGLLIDEAVKRERKIEECAYVLATAHHETGRFKYMEEIGRGNGRDYGESLLLIRGQRVSYHGRGFVQLTWLQNYARMSLKLGINLVESPDRAKDHDVAAQVIWQGMIDGDFTGKNLSDYFSDGADYVEARRIVNGTDRADLIAGYARDFEAALKLIGEDDGVCTICGQPAHECAPA